MVFALKYFVVLSVLLRVSLGTVFVEDGLYSDDDRKRVDLVDRLHLGDFLSEEKREVPSSQYAGPFADTQQSAFAEGDSVDDDSMTGVFLKKPLYYDIYEDRFVQNPRKTREKVHRSRMGRLRDSLFSRRKSRNKYKNYNGVEKDKVLVSSYQGKKDNLSKSKHSDVLPGLNEISV